MNQYNIATIAGDGIGPEITDATVSVMRELLGSDIIHFEFLDGGAGHYQRTGSVLPDDTYQACKSMHAILHGAAGLPDVVYPDGTEVGNDLHLRLRFELDLYANVRPIKLLPGVTSPLSLSNGQSIDYVIVRENTEGLYASRGGGTLLRDQVATDTLVTTRKGVERVAKFAFELSQQRQKVNNSRNPKVTVCDKANILRSYAFFRAVFNEVAQDYPSIGTDYAYVDAMTAYLVKRPEFYDVIVTENMFGDIISDLGAATVGGLGVSPSAELGDTHGLFQGAHGSAPDIAGQNVASPVATLLSGAMMLKWLGEKYQDSRLAQAAQTLEHAVERVLAYGETIPADLGGSASCTGFAEAVKHALSSAT